jgi:Zn-dependent protease
MFTADWWLDKLYLAPGILFGLVVHEFCHGYAAWRMGDPTAKLAGRLSFNPLKHLDLLGTVALFVARIGWAKPVPVDPRNFRDPRKGILITSLAGPASNLALGAVLGIALGALLSYAPETHAVFGASWLRLLYLVLFNAVYINFILAVFNLLPIPPLDGSNVLWSILPRGAAASYGRFIARYGRTVPIIFFLLIFLGPSFGFPIFQWLLLPPVNILVRFATGHSFHDLAYIYGVLRGGF